MNRQQTLKEDTHYRVLALLESKPNMSQRELAHALGVSLGGVNYSLRALMARGMIKLQNFTNSERKLAYAYLLTPAGMAEKASLTSLFLQRKLQEYEALKIEIAALQLVDDAGQVNVVNKTNIGQ
ncbi:MAG: MarR family EPS-associated transcriptional regulator [Methylotenera sp.]|nr:MarR family EPS-associated transcriptional regulator [Methylotenera sp.]